jgi:hypothetical protein
MKKVYYFLFFAMLSQGINAQIVGTWKLANRAGALGVGPGEGDISWWSNDAQALIDRACLFDDSLTFQENGEVKHYMDDNSWIEEFQGMSTPRCDFPVTPHDGYGVEPYDPFTYVYDVVSGTLTMNGIGAHLGLPKVINGAELTSNNDAPASIVYKVSFSNNNNTMTVDIAVADPGWWRFVYDRTDAPEITNPNVTFSVDMSQYTGTIGTGVFLNGSFNNWCGECTPMTNVGNNIWETTVSLPAGGIQYKFTVDGWSAFEEFPEVLPCIDNVADEFNNRYYEVTSDFSIPTVCFNSCEACLTSLNEKDLLNKLSITPNPSNDKIEITTNSVPTSIQVIDFSGAKVLELNKLNSSKNVIDVSKFAAGVYLLNVHTAEGIMIEKLIVN